MTPSGVSLSPHQLLYRTIINWLRSWGRPHIDRRGCELWSSINRGGGPVAIETFMPQVAGSDMMPLLACLDLLGESGHVMPPSTFRLHARRRRILVEKRGRTPYVSFSDAAEIHRDWVVARGK